MSTTDLPGSSLLAGRYRLVERLGAGGMSVVWRGFDEVLGRQVAVKVLPPSTSADPSFRRRLRAEAQAAARLSHPHITNVYDYGEATTVDGEPVPYVVMELVDGESLAAVLARVRRLSWPAAVQICAEVSAALAAAHSRGIVHRDVTPANVMLTSSGAKVVDFGISALIGENDIDPDGSLLGTPAYLAPERLEGGQVSPATDVYAVGLLIYRTLIGQLPWDVGTTTALLRAHQYTEPEPLPAVEGLPPAVAALIGRCLEKRPDDRPSSAELAHVLAGASAGAPAAARSYNAEWAADSGEDTTILPPQHPFTDGIGRIRAGHAKVADVTPAHAGRGVAAVRGGAVAAGAAAAAAGAVAGGPSSASPASARPASASPASARPVSAGPVSAGPVSAGPASVRPISVRPVSVRPVSAGGVVGPAGVAAPGGVAGAGGFAAADAAVAKNAPISPAPGRPMPVSAAEAQAALDGPPRPDDSVNPPRGPAITPPPPAPPTPAGPGRNAGPAGGARNSRFQGAPRQAAVASASTAPGPPQQGSGPAAGVRHAYGRDDKAGAPPRAGGGGGGTPPPKIRPAAPGKGGPPVRRVLIGAGMVVLLGAAVYAWSLSVGHDTANNAAKPSVVAPDGNCVVSYAVWSDDGSRFKAQVTVANRDVAPISAWRLWFLMNGDQTISSNVNQGENVPVSYSAMKLTQQGKEVSITSGGTLTSQQTATVKIDGQYAESNAAPLAFKLNGKTCETFVSSKPGEKSRQVEHLSNGTVRLGPVPTSKTPVPGITIGSNGIAVVKPTTKPTTTATAKPPGGGVVGPTADPTDTTVPPSPPPSPDQTTDPVVQPSSETPAPPSTLPSDDPACGSDPVDCEPLGP
jgi:hypothetical protein